MPTSPAERSRPTSPAPADLADTWSRIHAELRAAVPEATFQTWLEPLQVTELADQRLVLAAPAEKQRWVADRFGRVLQTCAAAVLGPDVDVDVVSARKAAQRGGGAPPRPAATAFRELELNPKYTFEQFVIGNGNRLAHAAALAVAELPAQAYNPLFIYGSPGLGKTHLLHAIAHYLRAYNPAVSVRCTTIEDFTSDFVNALQTGAMDRFKVHYRDTDVLLIDDIQFLQSKARTEEEFFHTFNALYETGSQLVLTSDRLPRDMAALEDRLCERFESGLVTDIEAPDLETRLAILRKRAQHDDIAIPDLDVLELIAARVTDNIRSLEGALIRVVAFQSLTQRPLTPELATEVLDNLHPTGPQRSYSVRTIQLAACQAFDVSLDDLLSRGRTARVAWPRQLAMFLTRELTDTTLPSIGRQFGDRDHTTVLYACQRVAQLVSTDTEARAALAFLRTTLESQSA